MTIDDSIKIWSYIIRKSDDECWPWVMGLSGGKPNIHLRNKMFTVSRVVYKLHYKIDPGELLVCHTCDNPICCNPCHFFLGTTQDNIDDKLAKGREPRVFTDEERSMMRAMRQKNMTLRAIAEKLNCHHTTVLDALRERIRNH